MNKKTIFRMTLALIVIGLFVGLAACGNCNYPGLYALPRYRLRFR